MMSENLNSNRFDVFIIGGGVNGCGIARDAAGRGLSVALAERGDLAGETSSASTKLFHGGLRYLEYFEFRLVREALKEREVLLRAMPHISWPMRFVLPYHSDQRFDSETPTSRLLSILMPWLKGRRPSWLIRFGLFLYDHLGGRKILPPTCMLNLRQDPAGAALKDRYEDAFEYSDCWVQDSRLVVLNARDAADHGAEIMTRHEVIKATPENGEWRVTVRDNGSGEIRAFRAAALVNSAGPWVEKIIHDVLGQTRKKQVRLVRGSHIVTRKLYEHDKCYFFQGRDGRIIFAIPYENEFTLIGTTDAEHPDSELKPKATEAEISYLIRFASEYFRQEIGREDVIWTYAGVRPLFDDGSQSAAATTREYLLKLEEYDDAPVLHVFGGKITTYRKLAEAALAKLAVRFPHAKQGWTAGVALPGGNFDVDGVSSLISSVCRKYQFLTQTWAKRLVRTYGTEVFDVFGDAKKVSDIGRDFGAGITQAELDWSIRNEWVRSAEDFVWRRTRLGLHLTEEQISVIDEYIEHCIEADRLQTDMDLD